MSLFNFKRKELTPEEAERRKKRAVVRYFTIVTSKFAKLVLLNLIYFACLIPLLFGIFTFACSTFQISPELIQKIPFLHVPVYLTSVVYTFCAPLAVILFLVSFLAYGPLTAGLTFCVRNLATERHFWISDMFSRAKSNLKQGIAIGLIDMLVLFSAMMYITLDLSTVSGGSLAFYSVLRIAAIAIAVVYFVARFYTYTIMVTVELPVKHIYRNAFLFCLPGFFRNIVALFLSFVILYSFTSTPKIDIILISTLLFSLARFSVVFATYKVIDQYLIKPAEKKDEEPESTNSEITE